MATASGSIAYLGAARFQGFWSASTNNATGSGLPSGKWNTIADAAMKGLFSTGSQNNSGYDGDHLVSASAGDYWQVTGSGTHNVEDTIQWSLNDWCIYSGSSGGTGTWIKLAFADTIASIIVGDLSSSSFHMGAANDKHIIFDSGSVHSGSKNFTFDYDNNNLLLTGTFTLDGNALLGDGDSDVTTVASQLTASAGLLVNEKAIINNDFEAKSKVTLGDAATDVATVTGQLTASQGIYATKRSIFASDVEIGGALHGGSPLVISGSVLIGTGCTDSIGLSGSLTASCDSVIKDDTKIYFGTDHDTYIEFDNSYLIISGASPLGTKISGTIVLGADASDIVTVPARLTASEGILASKKSYFNGDIEVDGLAKFDGSVILGNAAADITVATSQFTASEGILASKKSYFSGSVALSGLLTVAGAISASSDLTVGGNLLVNGATVTQDVVNSIIQDPIIGLGYGVTGSTDASTGSAGDRGLVMGLTGSNAVAMIWDNSATQFAFVTTANTPDAVVITPATYEDLRVSAIDIGGSAILDADGVTKVQHDVTGTLGGLKHAAGKLSVDIKNLPSGSDNMVATDLMVFQDGHASGSTRVLPISKLLNLITASEDAAVTAVNNKTESRLVTIGSTTSELDGEANLTYDGTTFVVNDDARVNDDLPLYFGSNSDAYIKYRETGDNLLVISGSNPGGLVLSGSKFYLDTATMIASGTLAGQGSYLGITATGQVVLGAPTGSSGGGSVAADDIGTGDAAIAIAGGSGHSITINATAAQAQLKTTTSGEVDITSAGAIDINAAAALTVDAVGASNITTNGALTVSGSTGLVLASDGGEIDITARLGLIDINASAGAIDIDAGTTIDIDAAGGINLGKASDVAFDVDTSTLDIDSSGAITIDGTSTFSVDAVGTSNVTTNGALTLSGSTGLVLASDGGEIDITARLGLIDINASAGAIDIDAAGAVTIDSSGGVISVGNDNIDQNVNIATGGSRTLNIGILDGTDTTTWTTKGNISHSGTFTIGGASTGFDAKLFGATTGKYLLWDESADELVLASSSKLSFHDAAGGENIVASSDGHLEINAGTTLDITATTVDVNGYLDVDGKVTIDPASDVGSAALTVTNTDTDQIAVDINASNIDANVLDIAADAVTSANVIEITADALSTGKVLNIVSNSSETDDRDLVLIHQDHSSAVNATPLRILQDAASCPALHVQGPTIGGQSSTASVNANGVTITIAILMTQGVAAANRGSSKTDTSDTAANIVAAIPNVRVGDSIEFSYINLSSNTVTFAGGTGVINLAASAASFNVASMNGRRFLFTIMNIGGGSESVVMSPLTAAFTLTS